ncbi:MAG: D-alanyl-D-alanine carboxypeptidase/D-alanyl-D-alanine-endopeptidase [Thiomargarita sp.]|nr:D-alanyl-D-alanine carboxypeptidase/D-alanyl-D-alanine-endopeptidase [Thiomargarita sp.]
MSSFKKKQYLLFNIFILLVGIVSAQEQNSFNKQIDKILDARCLDDPQTSVRIVALPSGYPIYTHNAYKPLLPASVMKIFTTATALHYLGPEYRFKTEFLYTGQRKQNTIYGDFIVRGGGDPTLDIKSLWDILRQLNKSGIDNITGDLIIDAHFFDQYDRSPAWEIDRSQKSYDAKISVLPINFNTIAIHVQPGQFIGNKLKAWLEPNISYMDLSNTTKTTKRGRNAISFYRKINENNEIKLYLKGKLSLNSKKRVIRINVENPIRYAVETIRTILKETGVTVQGSSAVVFTPITANLWHKHISSPLSVILKNLNTYSNNLTAEQIIKTIAADRYGTPGSHAEGLRLVEEFLRLSNVNIQGVALADGSGLSRKNRLTTVAVTDLLTNMYSRFDIGPDFISSLRVLGAYGVQTKRLKNSPAHGKIRAKTGTLKKVSTLAGYVANYTGKVYGYSIFLNNNKCGFWKADEIEDSIVTAIYNFNPSVLLNTNIQ